jgi:hypothetical protein
MCSKPLDQRTVAYLQKQQQLTMNSKCIIEPFKTSSSTINQIKDALSAIESISLAPVVISKSRTSKY